MISFVISQLLSNVFQGFSLFTSLDTWLLQKNEMRARQSQFWQQANLGSIICFSTVEWDESGMTRKYRLGGSH